MYCPLFLMSPALSIEQNGKQRRIGAFVLPTIFYSNGSVYIMRECMRTMSSAKSSLSVLFFSQHHSEFLANIISEKVFQVRTKECKTISVICKVNLNCLRSPRLFNCDSAFAVTLSLLSESVHSFDKIRIGSVKTRLQIVEL